MNRPGVTTDGSAAASRSARGKPDSSIVFKSIAARSHVARTGRERIPVVVLAEILSPEILIPIALMALLFGSAKSRSWLPRYSLHSDHSSRPRLGRSRREELLSGGAW